LTWLLSTPANAAKWWEAQISDFHIVSELDRSTTAGVIRDVELYRLSLTKLFATADIEPHMPVTVFLLSKKTWSAYITAQKQVAGLTFAGPDQMYIAVDGSAWLQAAPIVYHELTHVFLHKTSSGAALPVWLDEGYADFMSTVDTRGSNIQIGRPAVWRYFSMQRLPWMPLQDLLAAERDSAAYTKENLAEAFYAQSWVIVHSMIFGDPNRSKQIYAYLRGISGGMQPQQAFAAAFPGDKGEFEAELRDYSNKTKYKYREVPVPELPKKIDSEVKEMTERTAADELGDWMMTYSALDPDDMKFLAKRRADDNQNSLAAVHLARAYLRKENATDAKPLLGAYCKEASTYLHARNCGIALQELANLDTALDLDTATLQSRNFFLTALRVRPDDLPALFQAADTYGAVDGDATAVISGLERSLSRDPRNALIAYHLAKLYSDTDLRKAKTNLERAILNTYDPAMSRQMIEWLRDIETALAEEARATPPAKR
jgi:hypothetical protein